MWNEDKQQRFDELRIREAQGILTDAEREELGSLFAELDAEEAEARRPVLEQMQQRQDELRAEKERRKAEVAQLECIVREQEQRLNRTRPSH